MRNRRKEIKIEVKMKDKVQLLDALEFVECVVIQGRMLCTYVCTYVCMYVRMCVRTCVYVCM